MVEILRGRPDVFRGDRCVSRLVVHPVLGNAIGRCKTRNPGLRADRFVAEPGVAGHLVEGLSNVVAVGMAVDHHAVAAGTPEELIQRQSGYFAFDVPQRGVNRGDSAHGDRPAPPVRAAVEVLPDVLDAGRIAPDQGGRDVFFEVCSDGELAAVQRRIADSMDALIGFNHQSDEIATGAANDDATSADFHDATSTQKSWDPDPCRAGPVVGPLDHSIA